MQVPSTSPGQKLKFCVYDSDSDSLDLKKHDSLGSLEVTLGEILGEIGDFTGKLSNDKGVAKGEIMLNMLTQVKTIVEYNGIKYAAK